MEPKLLTTLDSFTGAYTARELLQFTKTTRANLKEADTSNRFNFIGVAVAAALVVSIFVLSPKEVSVNVSSN